MRDITNQPPPKKQNNLYKNSPTSCEPCQPKVSEVDVGIFRCCPRRIIPPKKRAEENPINFQIFSISKTQVALFVHKGAIDPDCYLAVARTGRIQTNSLCNIHPASGAKKPRATTHDSSVGHTGRQIGI